MGSSSQNKLFCPIRKIWCIATPEERVRQHVLTCMLTKWGYPESCIAVEKVIAHLPGLEMNSSLPHRRIDIAVFHPQDKLRPLLLIECKRHDITEEAFQQLIGYNYYIGADFVGVVGGNSSLVVISNKSGTVISCAPTYETLLSHRP